MDQFGFLKQLRERERMRVCVYVCVYVCVPVCKRGHEKKEKIKINFRNFNSFI